MLFLIQSIIKIFAFVQLLHTLYRNYKSRKKIFYLIITNLIVNFFKKISCKISKLKLIRILTNTILTTK